MEMRYDDDVLLMMRKLSAKRRAPAPFTLRHLAILKAVVDSRGFTAAARRLRVSQSAVSHAMTQLEGRLGFALLEATGPPVLPTQEGRVIYGYAERMGQLAAELTLTALQLKSTARGTLRVGAGSSVGTYILIEIVGAFERANPTIEIHLTFGNAGRLLEGVSARDLDIAFVPGPTGDEFQSRHFCFSEIVVVAAPGQLTAWASEDLPLSAIAAETWLMREQGSVARDKVDELVAKKRVLPCARMEFSSTEAIKQAARHGLGVAFLPRMSVASELDSNHLALVDVEGFPISYDVVYCWKERRPLLDTFLAFLASSR